MWIPKQLNIQGILKGDLWEMENGHNSRGHTQTLLTTAYSGLEQKEIRELPVEHIKKLGDILAKDDQWKDLMSQIPGTKSGRKRFDTNDVG